MTILAYLAAAWLIVGGAAMLWRRTMRFGAMALAIIYGIFGASWLRRFVTALRVLGYHVAVYMGLLGGIGM